jgi:hypothetical protein
MLHKRESRHVGDVAAPQDLKTIGRSCHSEIAKTTQAHPTLREVFELRCAARALLFAGGEYSLAEAVDGLQADAEAQSLVAAIGQDAVQAIMAAAFGTVRAEPERVPNALPDEDYAASGVARSTLDAAEYLIRANDPKRFEDWLMKHSAPERAAVVAHIERGRS